MGPIKRKRHAWRRLKDIRIEEKNADKSSIYSPHTEKSGETFHRRMNKDDTVNYSETISTAFCRTETPSKHLYLLPLNRSAKHLRNVSLLQISFKIYHMINKFAANACIHICLYLPRERSRDYVKSSMNVL